MSLATPPNPRFKGGRDQLVEASTRSSWYERSKRACWELLDLHAIIAQISPLPTAPAKRPLISGDITRVGANATVRFLAVRPASRASIHERPTIVDAHDETGHSQPGSASRPFPKGSP